jgi:hypothetical protein
MNMKHIIGMLETRVPVELLLGGIRSTAQLRQDAGLFFEV